MSGSQLPRLPPNEDSKQQTHHPDYPTNSGYGQPFKHGVSDSTFIGRPVNSSTASHLDSHYQTLQHQIEYPGVSHPHSQQEAPHSTSTAWNNHTASMATYSTEHLNAHGYTSQYSSSHYIPRGDLVTEQYNTSGYDRQLGNGPYNGPNETAATTQQAFNSMSVRTVLRTMIPTNDIDHPQVSRSTSLTRATHYHLYSMPHHLCQDRDT
jgi:hypothetical protein